MSWTFVAVGEYGGFLAPWKVIPLVIVAAVWLKLLTWADKDAKRAYLPRETTGLLGMGGFILAAVAYFAIPIVWISIPVLLALFAGGVIWYLSARKKTIGLGDLGDEWNAYVRSFGKEKKDQGPPPDQLILSGKNGTLTPPRPDAPERVIYDTIQSVVGNPLKLRANRIDLRPSGEGSNVYRYQVDGVPYEGKPSIQRDVAAEVIALLKEMAGLDSSELRKPQTGTIKAQLDKTKSELDLTTAGTTAGESMRLVVDHKKQYELTVDKLGLLPDQIKQIDELIDEPGGVVLLSAPETQGLSSLSYAMLRRHDAILSHIQSIERDAPTEVEGVRQTMLAPTANGQEEAKLVGWIISQEPDVIYVSKLEDAESARMLIEYALHGGETGKRVYVSLRAPSTFDAIAQWRKIVGDDKAAVEGLRLVISGRLIRKLCEACKIAYVPEPDALRKMGMSPDKVEKLFQARREPLRDQKGNPIVCEFCGGLGFKGRTGVYEFFKVDDDVRQTLLANGSTKQLQAHFRRQKQRFLQEAALAKVEAGETSVDEVLRVLRSTGSSGGTAAPAKAAAAK